MGAFQIKSPVRGSSQGDTPFTIFTVFLVPHQSPLSLVSPVDHPTFTREADSISQTITEGGGYHFRADIELAIADLVAPRSKVDFLDNAF